MIDRESLPYRLNVGAALFDRRGSVFLAHRSDQPWQGDSGPGWQLPQGGIDGDESPAAAVERELAEEIGTDRFVILSEHDAWLTYDLPDSLLGRAWGGRYRGQKQLWFALRFLGTDADIRLDSHPHPEFDAWRWGRLEEIEALAVAFKRPVYREIAAAFARFAVPEHA